MAFGNLGGGGGGFRLFTLTTGPTPAIFTAASFALAEAERDDYFTNDPNGPADLALIDADPFLMIALVDTSTDPDTTTYQNRQAGEWVNITPVVTGPPGLDGVAPFDSVTDRDQFYGTPGDNFPNLRDGNIIAVGDEGTGESVTFFGWFGGDSPASYVPAGWRVTAVEIRSGSLGVGPFNAMGANAEGRFLIKNSHNATQSFIIKEPWTDAGGSSSILSQNAGTTQTILFPSAGIVGPIQEVYEFPSSVTTPVTPPLLGSVSFLLETVSLDFLTAPPIIRYQVWEGVVTTGTPIVDAYFTVPGTGVITVGLPGEDRQEIVYDTIYTTRISGFLADSTTPDDVQFQSVNQGGGVFQPVSDIVGNGIFPRVVIQAPETNADNALITWSGTDTGIVQSIDRATLTDDDTDILFNLQSPLITGSASYELTDSLGATQLQLSYLETSDVVTMTTVSTEMSFGITSGNFEFISPDANFVAELGGAARSYTINMDDSPDTNAMFILTSGGANGASTQIHSGTRAPEGLVTGVPGAWYIRSNGTSSDLFIHKSASTSNTGWEVSGDVSGPSSSEDGAVAVFSGTTGKVIAERTTVNIEETATSSNIHFQPVTNAGTASILFENITDVLQSSIVHNFSTSLLSISGADSISLVANSGASSITLNTFYEFTSTVANALFEVRGPSATANATIELQNNAGAARVRFQYNENLDVAEITDLSANGLTLSATDEINLNSGDLLAITSTANTTINANTNANSIILNTFFEINPTASNSLLEIRTPAVAANATIELKTFADSVRGRWDYDQDTDVTEFRDFSANGLTVQSFDELNITSGEVLALTSLANTTINANTNANSVVVNTFYEFTPTTSNSLFEVRTPAATANATVELQTTAGAARLRFDYDENTDLSSISDLSANGLTVSATDEINIDSGDVLSLTSTANTTINANTNANSVIVNTYYEFTPTATNSLFEVRTPSATANSTIELQNNAGSARVRLDYDQNTDLSVITDLSANGLTISATDDIDLDSGAVLTLTSIGNTTITANSGANSIFLNSFYQFTPTGTNSLFQIRTPSITANSTIELQTFAGSARMRLDYDENTDVATLSTPDAGTDFNIASAGTRVEVLRSSADTVPILRLANNTSAFEFFSRTADPEGAVTGFAGCIASRGVDLTGSEIYFQRENSSDSWATVDFMQKRFVSVNSTQTLTHSANRILVSTGANVDLTLPTAAATSRASGFEQVITKITDDQNILTIVTPNFYGHTGNFVMSRRGDAVTYVQSSTTNYILNTTRNVFAVMSRPSSAGEDTINGNTGVFITLDSFTVNNFTYAGLCQSNQTSNRFDFPDVENLTQGDLYYVEFHLSFRLDNNGAVEFFVRVDDDGAFTNYELFMQHNSESTSEITSEFGSTYIRTGFDVSTALNTNAFIAFTLATGDNIYIREAWVRFTKVEKF